MKASRPVSWMYTAVLTAGLLVLASTPALANHSSYPNPDNNYSYTACSWNQSSRTSLRVAQSTVYPFPADSVAPDNGAPQSFRNMITDAASRWSTNYASASVGKTLTRVADGTTNEILFMNSDLQGGALAETFVRRTIDSSTGDGASRCPLRGSQRYTLMNIQIRFSDRPDWFTQSDPYRAAWEACGSNYSGYTCGKAYDFGAVAAHEIGHGLGLHHVQLSVNGDSRGCVLDGTNGSAWQPTMCSGLAAHRSEKRTLETFDRDTLHIHVDRNR